MKSKLDIAVLGKGVSGLSTALALLRAGHSVTILSKDPPEDFGTTSRNAYAVWTPTRLESDTRVEQWAFESLSDFIRLADTPATGVRLTPLIDLQTADDAPWYAARCTGLLPSFRRARRNELTSTYSWGHVLEMVPVIEPAFYLPWLSKQIETLGGTMRKHELIHIEDCSAEFNVIVNCTANGARLLCDDTRVYPRVLQSAIIARQGFEHVNNVVFDQLGPNAQAHIIPHQDYIRLGAEYGEPGNESLVTDEDMTMRMLERCSRLIPGFEPQRSDLLAVNRCLRPERYQIRVECDRLKDNRLLIHNYGHGGKAYITAYGIAKEICSYVEMLF